jgi:WD40 repeat protein
VQSIRRYLRAADVTRDGARICTLDHSGEVRIWSASGRVLATWTADVSGRAIAWLADDRHVLVQGGTGVRRWSPDGKTSEVVLAGELGLMQLSRDRKTLALGTIQGLAIFDLSSALSPIWLPLPGELQLSDYGDTVLQLVPRPTRIVLRLIDRRDGTTLCETQLQMAQPGAFRLAPDTCSVAIATGKLDRHRIKIIRLADGGTEQVLDDAGSDPIWLRFSCDGTRLWSSDGRARIWDLASGAVATLPGASIGVWSPSGDAMFRFGRDNKLERVPIALRDSQLRLA